MKEDLEEKLIDDLYQVREEELEKNYIMEYGKPEEVLKREYEEEQFINFIKKFIKGKNNLRRFYEKINAFECCYIAENC